MASDPQVVDYIKKATDAGQTKDQITSALVGNGWTQEEIDESFNDAFAPAQPTPEPQPEPAPVQPEPAPVEPASVPQDFGEARPEPVAQPEPPADLPLEPASVPQDSGEAKPEPIPEMPKMPEMPKIEETPDPMPNPVEPRPEPTPQPSAFAEASADKQPAPQQVYREPIEESAPATPEMPVVQPEIQPELIRQPQVSGKPQLSIKQEDEKLPPLPDFAKEYARKQRGSVLVRIFASLVILAVFAGVGFGIFMLVKTPEMKAQIKSYLVKFGLMSKSLTKTVTVTVTKTITKQEFLVQPAFADYKMENTQVTPALKEYNIVLSELANLPNIEQSQNWKFTATQKSALEQNNFFVAKNLDKFYGNDGDDFSSRNDDWTGLYQKMQGGWSIAERNPENAVFISTDFALHTYHKLLDNEFSYIEEASLYPALADLSKKMLQVSAGNYTKASGQDDKDSYERLSAYFLVSSAILDNAKADYDQFRKENFINDSKADKKEAVVAAANSLAQQYGISDNAKNTAIQEIGLIFDAKSMVPSPLMGKFQPGMDEDYTQFGPRSHYAKNVVLRDYFRAMMWYGRMNFLLSSPELTKDAANIAKSLSGDSLKQWETVFQPTVFFVGQADDLTVYDYRQAMGKLALADTGADSITKLQAELKTYRNPQIMSSLVTDLSVTSTSKEDLQKSTKGFRFMSQRFTPDGFIFSTLTQGQEKPDAKTGQSLPSMPTALMVPAVMGSETAQPLLDAWIKTNAKNSDRVLADRLAFLQGYFGKITVGQWTQNIYWSWMYTINSLLPSTQNLAGYPMFMKNVDWQKKSLQCYMGSWTELKHDTLLYAKQSYAERGAGGGDQTANPVVKGYVEPNVDFYDRLIALANLTDAGLDKFGLLTPNLKSRNAQFLETLHFYRQIAVQELENKTISDDDFEKLRLSAGLLDSILQVPDSQVQLESNARSALVADVHTDALQNKILYEADGIPNYVYVAVKDANGTRLTRGLVYSYYEFTGPTGKRLTDQDWQKTNYSPAAAKLKMPDWNKSLLKY